MKIIIFGHHHFTRRCIEQLIMRGHEVVLMCSNQRVDWINQYSVDQPAGLQSYWYDHISDDALYDYINDFAPDYIMSIIFAEKVPHSIIELARIMAINFHPADLPAYRGANAWFWPIRMGEKRSAISIHKMTNEWDKGDIVYKHEFALSPYETQGSYIQKVVFLAPDVIAELDPHLQSGHFQLQPCGEGHYYTKVKNRDIMIDWNEKAQSIESLVRACNPNHFAEVSFNQFIVQVIEVDVTAREAGAPGTCRLMNGKLFVSACDFEVKINSVFIVQVGLMSGYRFASLFAIQNGERFENIATLAEYSDCLDAIVG